MKVFSVVIGALALVGGIVLSWIFFGSPAYDQPIDAAAVVSTEKENSAAILPEKLSFNRHVQPILSANCYECHGPDSGSREAGLRLDQAVFARAPADSGEPVIRDDNLEASPILKRLLSDDPTEIMPPPEAHAQPTDEERALLVRWIREGAEYEDHWAF